MPFPASRPRPHPRRLPLLAAAAATAAAAARIPLHPNPEIPPQHSHLADAAPATAFFVPASASHVVLPHVPYRGHRRPTLPPSHRRSALAPSLRPPPSPSSWRDRALRRGGPWKETSRVAAVARGDRVGRRLSAAPPSSSPRSRWVNAPLRLAGSATDDDGTPSIGGGGGEVDVDVVAGDGGDDRTGGVLVLLTVPLAWGTFEPAVRYVYNEVDPPVPALLFTVGYYAVAALALCSLAWLSPPVEGAGEGGRGEAPPTEEETGGPVNLVVVADTRGGREGVGGVEGLVADDGEGDGVGDRAPSTQLPPLPSVGSVPDTGASVDSEEGGEEGVPVRDDGDGDGLPVRGGVELGTYLFLGNGLQVVGLKTVPSDRAAFLLQLTTIMVPLVQATSAGKLSAVPTRTWIACLIALAGVAVMGLDELQQPGAAVMEDNGGSVASPSAFFDGVLDRIGDMHVSHGDLLIVLAALAYTFHCVRLGEFARRTTPVRLAACKAVTETSLSVALLLFVLYVGGNESALDGRFGGALAGMVEQANGASAEIGAFVTSVASTTTGDGPGSSIMVPTLGAVAWTGLVTIAYTIYAQSYGQRLVAAADANLIYTVQPLFTALFAWALLGETLGAAGYAGGALIASAVALVATMEGGEDETEGVARVATTEGAHIHLEKREPAMEMESKEREG